MAFEKIKGLKERLVQRADTQRVINANKRAENIARYENKLATERTSREEKEKLSRLKKEYRESKYKVPLGIARAAIPRSGTIKNRANQAQAAGMIYRARIRNDTRNRKKAARARSRIRAVNRRSAPRGSGYMGDYGSLF